MSDPALTPTARTWVWRHPRPLGAQGRCIGHTDLGVPPRRAKRLARRIQAAARRHGLPRVVHTSPLRRCADVGRWLRRWGWTHHRDPALLEMNFGKWEGRAWAAIPREDIDAWCQAFTAFAPGGGETLAVLLQRAAQWTGAPCPLAPCVVVAHAGWMLARSWTHQHPVTLPRADQWPAPPGYGELWCF